MKNFESYESKCEAIIHTASVACGAVGVSPIPGSDALPIMAIQTTMVLSLANVFGIGIDRSFAMAMVKEQVAKQAGKMIASQLTKLIPFVGSAINATVAAGITEVLGWDVAREFYRKSLRYAAQDKEVLSETNDFNLICKNVSTVDRQN